MKRWIAYASAVLAVLCLAGCFSSPERALTYYFGSGKIVSVRYFNRNAENGPVVETLDEERIPEILDSMGAMTVRRYSFHTDYFWGGRFGIEMETEDGTFVCYDGTRLVRSSASMLDEDAEAEYYDRVFLEVTNCDFWEKMKDYFPDVRNLG